ncbi:hypothetical protein [Lacticaseibacillus sharpeae]|nr:hypothetical protein [Lacticaseibacillus sharpeae]
MNGKARPARIVRALLALFSFFTVGNPQPDAHDDDEQRNDTDGKQWLFRQ